MSISQPTAPPLSPNTSSLESLKGRRADTLEGEKARLRKATKEFESFFTHYLLKTMRKTIPESPFSEGLPFQNGAGREVFTDLFDMEVARHVSTGGNGSLSDVLFRSMKPLIEAEFNQDRGPAEIKPLNSQGDSFTPLTAEPLELNSDTRRQMILGPDAGAMRRIRPGRTTVPDDEISARFGREIRDSARRHRLDPALIHSVIKAESAGNPRAVSHAGAKGLMQLIDSTATSLGLTNVFDPAQNIEGGASYLKQLIDRYGDVDTALAAYNAGPGAVDRHGGIPPYRETEAYVERVKRYFEQAKSELNAKSAKARSHANR
jgi:Rod binding domain-containing protein